MRALNALIYRGIQRLLTALLAVMILPVTMQIASRFVEVIPRYIWTEEVARFCLIWLIMLGSTIAVRDGTHFDVDVLPSPRTARGKAIAGAFVHAAILLVAIVFVGFGVTFAEFGYIQNSEMTGINMLSIYVAWPLAGVVWCLFVVEQLADDLKRYREGADVAA